MFQKQKNQPFDVKIFYIIGGIASMILGLLFIITAASSFSSSTMLVNKNDLLSLISNNWLVVIFKLHEFKGFSADIMQGLSLLDIIILALFSILCFGLSTAFKKSDKVWSVIAFVLSLIAIILFLVTQIAGRSTVMLSVMINSLVMFNNKIFNKLIFIFGILASIFLFIGDLTVGSNSMIITILFAIGYILLTIWFFLVAGMLIKLGLKKIQ